MMKPLISVILCTLNRYEKLKQCLITLSRNNFNTYEVIIVDQSDNNQLSFFQWMKKLPNYNQLRYFHQNRKNLSAAWNYGIKKSNADIIAFTDDDCIVKNNWLNIIYSSFNINKNISAVFGNTSPYSKTKPRHNAVCPCIFEKKQVTLITEPCFHAENVGFSNNMSIRRKIFVEVGFFKEWLGPGSIGIHGNDAEMIFRMLVTEHTILYNPKMIVWHNKWLLNKDIPKQDYIYSLGELTAYGYYAFMGNTVAQKVISENIQKRYKYYRNDLINSVKRFYFIHIIKLFCKLTYDLIMVIRCLIISLYHCLIA